MKTRNTHLHPLRLTGLLLGSVVFASLGHAQQCEFLATAGDPDPFDNLGEVAIEGDYMLAGAELDDEFGSSAGAAYVFERNLGGTDSWGQRKKVVGLDTDASDRFGSDVDVENGKAFIGARNVGSSGALYIFDRLQGGLNNWGQIKKIPSPTGLVNDSFGFSVSAEATRVLVGAPEDVAFRPGHAYIYDQNVGGFNNFGLQATLQGNGQIGETFGVSADIDTDTAIVGANGADDLGQNSGAAYIFDRNQGGSNNWGQVVRLKASDAEAWDLFGVSVAIQGDYALVAAMGDDGDRGAVYVFWRHQGGIGNWGEVTKIVAPDGSFGNRFGYGLDLWGTRALVGAPDATYGGAAYLIEKDWGGTGAWGVLKRINATDFGANDAFGQDVVLNASDAVVGAPGRDTAGSSGSGGAYVLDVNQCIAAMPYGFCHTGAPCGNTDPDAGCANSTGSGALLTAAGSSSVSQDDLVLTTSQMPTGVFGIVFMGDDMKRVFLGDGLRVAGGAVIRLTPATNSGPSGQIVLGSGIAAGQSAIQPGTTWNFQTWYRDNSGPCSNGTNLSNGMSVSFRP